MNESDTKNSRSEQSRWVVSTTKEAFQADVFEQSRSAVVVVDFWAPWCAPCRALGPILERLAEQYGGRFILVKANTDEMPDAAAQFKVQGIPAVFSVSGGEILDGFTGVMPEPQIRTWLDRMLAAHSLGDARDAEAVDLALAEQLYRRFVAENPRVHEAQIGLARTLLAMDRLDESREVIAELERRGFLEPEAQKIKAALDLGQKSSEGLDEHRAAAQADPDNLELQLQLAESLVGAQQFEESLKICLSLVERDRKNTGERARKLMIDIFRVLPEDSELTTNYRRKLSMALF
jgi:putative thioredoxin